MAKADSDKANNVIIFEILTEGVVEEVWRSGKKRKGVMLVERRGRGLAKLVNSKIGRTFETFFFINIIYILLLQ